MDILQQLSKQANFKARASGLYDDLWLKQFPESFVLPQYDGLSIANIPATVGHLLDVSEGWASESLDQDILAHLPERTKRVVLLVVDGIAYSRLLEQLQTNDAGFSELFEKHGLHASSLTSVAPSTTSVATTVLTGNGATAAETGMVGYSYLLSQLGLVANMLFWQPAWQQNPVYASLESWGISPETFLETPSAAQVLSNGGVDTRVIMPAAYSHSPLSRMQMRGAEIDGYMNQTDMWLKLQTWLSDTQGKRAHAYMYYADFDSLSHRDGSDSFIWSALWENFCFELQKFFSRLQDAQDTVLLMTADHGHLPCSLEDRFIIEDYPQMLESFSVMPGGEARHMYLYAQHGAKDELLDYATKTFADKFIVLDANEALKKGLYGSLKHMHPDTMRRIGDVVLISQGRNYLWPQATARELKGKHGGLESTEMIVPFIALNLT